MGIDIFSDGSREHARPLSGFIDKNFADGAYQCVLQADCTEELPIKSGSCQTVCCISGMEYIADYMATLREARRILAPGGVFILTANTEQKIRFYRELLQPDYYAQEFGRKAVVNILDHDTWHEALTNSGFAIEKCSGYMDGCRAFLHMLTTYPNCYDTFWSQKRLGDMVRNDPFLLEMWQDKVLPWLTGGCPVSEAGILAFKCVAV